MPGIPDKNSNPPISFSFANSDNFLSKIALPAIIVVSFNFDTFEKLFPNFIIGRYFPDQIGVYLNVPIDSGHTQQKRVIYTTDEFVNVFFLITKTCNNRNFFFHQEKLPLILFFDILLSLLNI